MLRKKGVRASVLLPQSDTACPAAERAGVTPISWQNGSFSTDLVAAPDYVQVIATNGVANKVRVKPSLIPAGQRIIIAPVVSPAGPMIQISIAPEPGPRCVVDISAAWFSSQPSPSVSRT